MRRFQIAATEPGAHAIASYWGKARPVLEGPTWHPLAWHALDVAGVMAALLEQWPWVLERLAAASGLSSGAARGWALAVAALHDLGKFADAFQAKAEPWRGRAAWGHQAIPQGFDHSGFGRELWDGWKDSNGQGRFDKDSQRRFEAWLLAAFGHHGRPVAREHERPYRIRKTDVIRPEAEADAHVFVDAVLDLYEVAPSGASSRRASPLAETWMAAGLCVIADWIGSNQRWFPYCEPDRSISSYWDEVALPRATHAVNEAGLASAQPADIVALAQLTGRADEPTPLQAWAAEVILPEGPVIAVIEDLTGAGKTEAALLLAHRMILAGKGRGLYWALPTQATSNMLHARLKPDRALGRAGYRALFAPESAPSLALAHGGVDLSDAFRETIVDAPVPDRLPGEDTAVDRNESTATAQCAAWLADERRKSLLAHIGVGTIDQALMAALPRKFAMLRQAALAGQVLVVDEVHGYDPFVAEALRGLLRAHASLGGSAILVSATFATETKQSLVDAFTLGARREPILLGNRSFPLATMAGATVREDHLSARRGTLRDLSIRWLEGAQEAISYLQERASRGECAVWVRNTVADALDAYKLLQASCCDLPIALFHARFAAVDRARIESEVLARFGPGEGDRRVSGVGRVLVATQVVEQSLDLDFDVMVSDLALIELLIQRAGRLHRHRREGRQAPELAIVSPSPVEDAGERWYAAASPRGAYVYPDHAALWAAARLLKEEGELPLARCDPRALVERVALRVRERRIPEALLRAHEETFAKGSAHRALAAASLAEAGTAFHEDCRCWSSDDLSPTRLGEPQRVLRLARWEGDRLRPWADGDALRAWRLSEVAVAAHRIESVACGPWDDAIRFLCEKEVRADVLIVPLSYDQNQAAWKGEGFASQRLVTLSYAPERGLEFA